jgi:hypothetical protein
MLHYPMHRANWLTVVGVVLAIIIATIMAAAVLLGYSPPAAAHSCSGVQINPGQDLDAIVNNDPSTRATIFCVHAPPRAPPTRSTTP